MNTRLASRILTAAIPVLAGLSAMAQTPPAATVLGQVEATDVASRTLTIKTGDGTTLVIALAAKATVMKVAPGETSLQNATPIEFAGIAAGDRVLVRGGARSEGKVDGALRVIIMAQTDLARRDEEELRAWRERAVVGTVTAVDPAKDEFTIHVSSTASAAGLAGQPGPPPPNSVVIDARKAKLHRYADTSAKYADAKPARVSDIAEGDQLRLLGTRSADGSRIEAERVVFGSFRTRALAIEKVNPDTATLEVKDLESNQKFSISMVQGGSIRKISQEMAPMLVMMAGGGRPGGPRGEGAQGGARPEGVAPSAGGGRPEGPPGAGAQGATGGRGPRAGGPRGGRGMPDLVERMPVISLAELKKDDWVGAVIGKIDDRGHAIAFNMLAGIEIFASRANRSGGVEVGMPAGLLDGAIEVP